MPVQLLFDTFSLGFAYRFRNFDHDDRYSPTTTKTTELYLPARRYAEPLRAGLAEVILSDGKWEYKEEVGLGY